MPVLAPLEKLSLRERVSDVLSEKILGGYLNPGDRLVESVIAQQMRVAQNTVREALQILEHQGLVTKVPKVGTFVTRFTDEEVSQVYRVRVELEGLAVELASEKLNDAGKARLEGLAALMDTEAKRGDLVGFVRADLEFHRAIWQLSGNKFLEKALVSITQPLFAYLLIRYFPTGPRNIEAAVGCHRNIVEKMKDGDAVAARAYAAHQIRDLWAGTLQQLELGGNSGSEAEHALRTAKRDSGGGQRPGERGQNAR